MKRNYIRVAMLALMVGGSVGSFAGNKDRSGQAGAAELLLNPWAQSTGLFGQNTSYIKGIEAMKSNIAGLAHVENLEVGAAYTVYLQGSNVSITNAGIAQKIGDIGVLGFNIMSMGFGEIPVTDVNNPEGGIGSYRPQFLNISLGFSRKFNNNISAGFGATFVSQQISSIRANGAAFEAGVQYVTGKRDNLHIGVALRNVGTNMRFTGGGFSYNTEMPNNPSQSMSVQTPTEKFELPTYLNFGVSYDFYLDENQGEAGEYTPNHRLSAMVNFTSNSFNSDYLGGGLEYAFKEQFMLRAAYRYEAGIFDAEQATTFYTGVSAGATIQQQLGANGPRVAIDYSYRPTRRPNNGVHTFSMRFMLPDRSNKGAIPISF